jgi:hypothetical protein
MASCVVCLFGSFIFWCLEFVSSFDIRISDLPLRANWFHLVNPHKTLPKADSS